MMKRVFSLFALALLTMSAWAANTYVKVTSVDQLEADKKYILVNEANNRAMGEITGTTTNYGSAVTITIDNGVIDIEGTDAVELTASERNSSSNGLAWNFKLSDGTYIIWTSGNSLNRVNIAAGLSGAMWIPALTDDGVILKNNADMTRILQYNQSSPRFACYASAQKPAVLYVEGEPEDEGITTLSQANALEDGEFFAFKGNAVVTAQKGKYLFLRDESGYGMIKDSLDCEFENGQVLNPGWEAIKTSNEDGWAWYTNVAGISASAETNAELAAAQKLTGAVDESMLNAYVYIENVTLSFFPPRSFTLPDNTTIGKTEVLWASNWSAGGNFNIYGIICKVDGVLKINVINCKPYVEPTFLPGDVNGDGFVNISDAILLINLLLNEGEMPPAADFNGNGMTDISDATELINHLLNTQG